MIQEHNLLIPLTNHINIHKYTYTNIIRNHNSIFSNSIHKIAKGNKHVVEQQIWLIQTDHLVTSKIKG